MAESITSPDSNYSGGIDARSSENQIQPGFVADLLNSDIVERRAKRRLGYQGYAGNLPVRVTALQYNNTTNEVCFSLDSSVSLDTTVDLAGIRSTPIVVYGRSSTFSDNGGGADDGPFVLEEDRVRYYNAFHVPTRKQFIAPSGTLSYSGDEHGLGTDNLFVSVVEATDVANRSYSKILTDTISIDTVTYDIDIDYTTAVDRSVFVFLADKTPVTGSTYIATLVHPGGGAYTFPTITAGTHGLQNFNIVPQIYKAVGGNRERVLPDTFVVDPNNGDVDITATDAVGGTYYFILSAAPISNTAQGNIAGNSTSSVIIPNVEKPAVFFGIYLELTPGGDLELVIPDSINYDDTTKELSLEFTNSIAAARNFIIFYEYGSLQSNQLCVIDTDVTVSGTDERPQLTIWGLDHTEIYGGVPTARAGWTNHIDSYRRSGEQRMVSGLGGNLFAAQEYSEAATTYALPILYPNLQIRTSVDLKLGPTFWDSGETPARTRGYITGDTSGTNWVTVTAVAYNTGTGYTDYTLSIPNKLILDSTGTPTSLGSVISTTAGLQDYLTVEGMSYSRHDGTFRIRSVTDGVNQIVVSVENSNNSVDYNDSGTAGQAGIFTDQYSWMGNSPFISGDVLSSPAISSEIISTVVSSVGSITVADGFVSAIDVAGGVTTVATRTSAVVPLRNASPDLDPEVTNLVRGDMLSYGDLLRELRVLYINSDSNRTINITSALGVATATLQSGDTSFLTPGKQVLIREAGVYTGVVTVEDVISDTEFTFTTTETISVSGALLVGNTVQIDEELEWSDSIQDANLFRVERRWIPIEAPDDSFDLTPSTYIRQLDARSYTEQSFLRSTTVQDNMYLTNYQDEVFKFDGSNIYRAGLINWQPGLFLIEDQGTTAKIVCNNRQITWSGSPSVADRAAGRLPIPTDSFQTIPVGTPVKLQGSTQTYTVRDYHDGSPHFIFFDRSLDSGVSGTAGTISEIAVYRYYYRLNAVDPNNNIIASAVAQSQDYVMELTSDASIKHRLVGMPAWEIYDYARLEVQIYRTRKNTSAPYYLITTLELDFDNADGYVDYTDSFADSDLIDLDITSGIWPSDAAGNLSIPSSWSEPLRARYISSISNRLVLGNVRDYPQLDLQIVAGGEVTTSTYAGTRFLLRRSNTDAATTTDMVNRVAYQFRDSGAVTIAPATDIVNNAGVSFTVTEAAHGLTAGDWVYLFHATVPTTGHNLTYAGWWQINSVNTNDFTIIFSHDAAYVPSTADVNRYVTAAAPKDVPIWLGTDGNLGMFNGDSFDLFDTMRRMSLGLNASMRKTDITVTGQESFTPWIISRGGNDVGKAGRLLIRQPRTETSTVELVPTFSGFSLFVNEVRRASGDQISASTRIYPSRILVSEENYPEIFENPTDILDSFSRSALDINSADGQEITGVLPFFGEAAFGAAQQSGILVVFKTNSIYLVDINEKLAGRNPVQRIETEGLGCTFPYSIAVTKNGIMFANESGVYCLRRNQAIQYIGKYMERNWTERVDLQQQELVHGHHYGVGRAYKLSVPIESTVSSTGYIAPTEAYVYNHTNEDEQTGLGAWGRYDNHPAVGWANLLEDAYFASSTGRVFQIRNTGEVEDYRDDAAAINMVVTLRANDFGNSGTRKTVDQVIAHYRNTTETSNTIVGYAPDLEVEFETTQGFTLKYLTTSSGIGDAVNKIVKSIKHSLRRRRCTYMQIQVTNSDIDTPLELVGIDYKVIGLNDKGMTEAAQTGD